MHFKTMQVETMLGKLFGHVWVYPDSTRGYAIHEFTYKRHGAGQGVGYHFVKGKDRPEISSSHTGLCFLAE